MDFLQWKYLGKVFHDSAVKLASQPITINIRQN